ncbi:MAG: type II secretion system F family protein [Beutenbergiaceae bacterium]
MGTVVGLLLGAGLLGIWWSFWPRPERAVSVRSSRIRDLLVQAGMPGVSIRGFILTSTLLALTALVLVLAVTATPPIAVCFAVMAGVAPSVYVRAKSRRRRESLRALWPDVVDDLASAVRAGLSIPEALIALGQRGPEPLRPEFVRFASDYRASGRFAEALDLLKARLADPVADRIVEALRLTRDVGGTDLGRLLRSLSQFLRDDLRARGELEARQSWTVNGARLAAAAPWLVLAILSFQSTTITAYNSPAGVLVLLVGAAASVVAYQVMVRLGRLPEEERVMR